MSKRRLSVNLLWNCILIAVMLIGAVTSFIGGQTEDFLGYIATIIFVGVCETIRVMMVKPATPPSPALMAWLDEQSNRNDNLRSVPAFDLCDYD